MKTLFAKCSEIKLVPFLNDNAKKLELLCDPSFVADLYYARRNEENAVELSFPIETLSTETFDRLRRISQSEGARPLFVIAAPNDEAARLRSLVTDYPELDFVGLAEHVVPAIVAQSAHKLFDPLSGLELPMGPLKLVLVVATPRSGSSYVCDVLEGLGIGRPKEHLRDTLIELFASGYKFDKPAAIRNFLFYCQRSGWVGTKLITHFVEDFITTCGLSDVSKALDIPIESYAIFLDRNDRARQAISGELAARRGIWHVTNAASRKKVAESKAIHYDFYSILKRYIGYSAQSSYLDALRPFFPRRLEIFYENDVVDHDSLIARLTEYLGVDPSKCSFAKADQRERIAGDLNDDFKAAFSRDFMATFGNPLPSL